MRTFSRIFLLQGLSLVFLAIGAGSVSLLGQAVRVSTARGTATVLIEPYAPNIVRVSISSIKSDALAGPGYGIVSNPDYKGWSLTTDHGTDVLQSGTLRNYAGMTQVASSVTVARKPGVGEILELSKWFEVITRTKCAGSIAMRVEIGCQEIRGADNIDSVVL
jgi:hypothetical protein